MKCLIINCVGLFSDTDLDDTLYSTKIGLAEALRKNIDGAKSFSLLPNFTAISFLEKKKNEIVNLLFLILSSDYLVEKCGFPESEASNLRYELFKTYGSSLAGLRVIHLSF